MAVFIVGDGRPDGVSLGRATTEKIGFYGSGGVAKQTVTQQTGTQTTTQLRAELTALQDALAALGLVTVA